MLATLTDNRFSDPGWIFERKLDGERALAFCDGDCIRLLTRNGKMLNDAYPELVDAIAGQRYADFVAGGEIVAFDGNISSFSRLQQRMQITDAEKARASTVPVYYYLFDLPYLEGHDLSALPLRERKKLLKQVFDFSDAVRFTPHRNSDGEALLKEDCDRGWEGLIAKRADALYRHSRSTDWLKLKCGHGQEFVIGGFTEPHGSRIGFGALRYPGKVGTGFDDDFLRGFRDRLNGLVRDTSSFADEVQEETATFVIPDLVAEIGFTEWTDAGKWRHPRFLGLRDDKAPRNVVRERPVPE